MSKRSRIKERGWLEPSVQYVSFLWHDFNFPRNKIAFELYVMWRAYNRQAIGRTQLTKNGGKPEMIFPIAKFQLLHEILISSERFSLFCWFLITKNVLLIFFCFVFSFKILQIRAACPSVSDIFKMNNL